MNINLKLILLLLFSGVTSYAQEVTSEKSFFEKLQFTTNLEVESAYDYNKQDLQKLELIAKPEIIYDFNNGFRFKFLGRIYTDATDHLEPNVPTQMEVGQLSKRGFIGDRLEVELRELYLDFKLGKSFITIGKQQTVWGKSDGLRVLDVVNPFNYREFIFDDFEDSRIPLWSLKADIPLFKNTIAQIIWLPDNTYNDIPNSNARFALPGLSLPTQIPSNINYNKPKRFFRDSDIGVRLSSFINGWDVTVNYLYHYNDFPLVSTSSNNLVNYAYMRNHLLGATFSNAFGNFTLRGEVGYLFNNHFQVQSSEPDFKASDQLQSVLGLDYYGLSNTILSVQVFGDVVTDIEGQLIAREDNEYNASFLINRNFKNETITARLIAVQNLKDSSGFINAKLDYLIKSNVKIWLGGEFIFGQENTQLGVFSKRDRLLVGLEVGL